MIVISDTNILSSLAAADSLHLLSSLFPPAQICIPPAVQDELRIGLNYGNTHLEPVLQAISEKKIKVLSLSSTEKHLSQGLPSKLNAGECEAIALSQNRKARLLSNDKKAVRYCKRQGIRVLDLLDILRLLWTSGLISRREVEELIDRMVKVENLKLPQKQRDAIFAPYPAPPPRRRRRKS